MSITVHCCVRFPQDRLDLYLRDLLGGYSRTMINDLIERREAVSINGIIVTKSSTRLKAHDELMVACIDQKQTSVSLHTPSSSLPPFDILYEDEHCLVINKPLGIAVHPGDGVQTETTIVDMLIARSDISLSIKGTRRPGIVHRLDKWTSGCLLLAKHDRAVDYFVRCFQERRVQKTYLTLVHGSFPHQHGFIEAPVGRHHTDRKKMSVIQGGKDARTEFILREKSSNFSLVEIILHTGRTHQIRVHFSSIGYPVVGDPEYGNKENPFPELLQGQWLHAWKLSFPSFQNHDTMITVSCSPSADFLTVLEHSHLDHSFITS